MKRQNNRARHAILLALFSAVLFFSATTVTAEDWAQFLGPRRDGSSAETNLNLTWPETGPKKLWQMSVGVGYSSVAVVGNRLYTIGNADGQDVVRCVDVEKGVEIWKYSYACPSPRQYPGPRATPSVSDNRVYTFSRKGHLFCLDATNGKVVWSKDVPKELGVAKLPGWELSCSPLVDGNLLLLDVGSPKGSLTAFDKTNGRVLWQAGGDAAGYSSPVIGEIGGKRVVFNFTATNLFGVDVANGQVLWKFPWVTAHNVNSPTPLIIGNNVLICSDYGKGSALLEVAPNAVKPVWEEKFLGSHFSTPVLWKDHVFGMDGNISSPGALQCVNPKTKELKWSQKGLNGGFVLAEGKLIVLTKAGRLSVVDADPTAFKESSVAQVLKGECWTAPVLAGGRLYCRAHDTLICFDLRK